MVTRISQLQYNYATASLMCKKGDNWVVWILNSHLQNISTTLAQSSSSRSYIRFGDLI